MRRAFRIAWVAAAVVAAGAALAPAFGARGGVFRRARKIVGPSGTDPTSSQTFVAKTQAEWEAAFVA